MPGNPHHRRNVLPLVNHRKVPVIRLLRVKCAPHLVNGGLLPNPLNHRFKGGKSVFSPFLLFPEVGGPPVLTLGRLGLPFRQHKLHQRIRARVFVRGRGVRIRVLPELIPRHVAHGDKKVFLTHPAANYGRTVCRSSEKGRAYAFVLGHRILARYEVANRLR
ncbi:MAG: hypothetical protein BWY06_03236 [Candidatus Latescibacteria bacterium ADurb.Bin168]|nr:MAG: hypothetical protein BWY06_03236 [Candidatus Latescibacteria bacterium ADurb.Bin168]